MLRLSAKQLLSHVTGTRKVSCKSKWFGACIISEKDAIKPYLEDIVSQFYNSTSHVTINFSLDGRMCLGFLVSHEGSSLGETALAGVPQRLRQ